MDKFFKFFLIEQYLLFLSKRKDCGFHIVDLDDIRGYMRSEVDDSLRDFRVSEKLIFRRKDFVFICEDGVVKASIFLLYNFWGMKFLHEGELFTEFLRSSEYGNIKGVE